MRSITFLGGGDLRYLGWVLLMLAGAVILSPVVAMLGLDPLPGDFHMHFGETNLYVPLGTSLIASVALTLLFFTLRR